ncbi:MAG: tRNA 2-thiocytidine biosynthesis protein TtcA [Bacilli bacterium]|nr:tRNA 2-thiocytidine biosynthesis protein TtcA [Bacilli bacterium]
MSNKEIERSIIKKFRKDIWAPFVKGINDYKLIQENDRIAVCISGGKDSFLLAKCLQEIKRHGKMHFELKFIAMDPGYKSENLAKIIENAKRLEIPLDVFKTDVFAVSQKLNAQKPCYICARMRRGYLYSKAQELGCNKIALGHHFDDVIETILLSMLYGGEVKTMMPKLHSDNYMGMELIRPLYLIKEEAIINWAKYNNLQFINCACLLTDSNKDLDSKRLEMKMLINNFRKTNPYIEQNIFKSVHNINLNTIIGYHKGDLKHNFLDDYDSN